MTAPDDWLAALRTACAESSQSAVAKRLGISPAAVSQVLAGKYAADTGVIEQKVRGVLMNKVVDCPVLGELNVKICLDWQARPFAATSEHRTRMYRACRRCPHSKIRE